MVDKKAAPAFSLGSNTKSSIKDNGVPGPGSYNVNDDQVRSSSRGAFISRTQRFTSTERDDGDRPGPGQYSPDSGRNGRGHSFGKATTRDKGTSRIGPGCYDVDETSIRKNIRTVTTRSIPKMMLFTRSST